jgi:DNA-directed RNA polymerase specialized sigma24 family protein
VRSTDPIHSLLTCRAQIVECCYFGGMTEEETAAALGIALRTAQREWSKARSWLYQEISPERSA